MKKFFLLLVLVAATLSIIAQDVKKVAVWETKCSDNSITTFQSTMVRGGMETAVGNTPGYEVYDRSAFDAIMKEHNFQRSGAVDDKQIRQLGVMAGVQYIIVPEATVDGNEFYILVKMLDVETGKFGAVYEDLCGPSGVEIRKACSNLGIQLFGNSGSRYDGFNNKASNLNNEITNDNRVGGAKNTTNSYPEDQQSANEMINSYILQHREREITDLLEVMAKRYPEQPVYCFILGTIYGDLESDLYDLSSALRYYDKAIEADDEYIDAYYNSGAILVSLAREKYMEADDKDPNDYVNFNSYLKDIDDLAAQAKSYDQRALPYLEKCYKLDPSDDSVKTALQGVYVRLKINKKL